MALVIFNIGWMNDYQGLTESDPIVPLSRKAGA